MAKLKFKAADGNIYSTHDLLRDKIGDNNLAVKLPSGNVGYLPTELANTRTLVDGRYLYIAYNKHTAKVLKVSDLAMPGSDTTILKIDTTSADYTYIPAGYYSTGHYRLKMPHSSNYTPLLSYFLRFADSSGNPNCTLYAMSMDTTGTSKKPQFGEGSAIRTAQIARSSEFEMIYRNIDDKRGTVVGSGYSLDADHLQYDTNINIGGGDFGASEVFYVNHTSSITDTWNVNFERQFAFLIGKSCSSNDFAPVLDVKTLSAARSAVLDSPMSLLSNIKAYKFVIKLCWEETVQKQGSGGVYYYEEYQNVSHTANNGTYSLYDKDRDWVAKFNVPMLFIKKKSLDLTAPTVT